jgi:N-acetylmuramoyl-L-alanine amidase
MKYIYTLLILMICISLTAEIQIVFQKVPTCSILPTTTIEKQEYIKLADLNTIFRSYSSEEIADSRLNLNLYGEQFVFLLNSPYVLFQDNVYNVKYTPQVRNCYYYVPASFVTEFLPSVLPKEFKYQGDQLLAQKPVDNSIQTIVIDPGHGGKDPGAVGYRKTHESDITLKLALMLKAMLEKELGVRVLLTRSINEFVSLNERTTFANDNKADLFISIHCNASKSRSAEGTEVYYLSTARTTETRAVEAMENEVVAKYEGGQTAVKKYDDLTFILSDMMQTEQLEESNALSQKLINNIVIGTSGLDHGVHQAGFYVLRGAFMPSVLIETEYISNLKAETKLTDPTYQEMVVKSIFYGIKSFKYQYDRIRNS